MSQRTIEQSKRNEALPEHHNYIVYSDGEFRRYGDVHLHLMTHAFSYGTGCFEGMRAYWNRDRGLLYLLQGRPHFRRLLCSAKLLRIDIGNSVDELVEIAAEVLRRNRFQSDIFLRPTAYKSSEEIGVRLTGVRDSFAIYAIPFGNYIDLDRGLRCMVSSWRRISDDALPPRAKITGSYVNSALAKSEALDNGYDEAIVLGASGHVSEGSAENLFMFRDGRAITPPVYDEILEGVTRRCVIELLEAHGIPVVERSIDRTELYSCDELVLCGTAAQVTPVVEVDQRPVGEGRVGEIVRTLQQAYLKAVRGEDDRFSHWLTEVRT